MIGLLPAAGKAKRMHGLPKFLLPIGDTYLIQRHFMLLMSECDHIWVGASFENQIYLPTHDDNVTTYVPILHRTMSETVESARMWMGEINFNNPILFGMPDTYIEDDKVYHKLAKAIQDGADVAVALFAARFGQYNGGLCQIEGNQVVDVVDKPGQPIPEHPYIWGALAWKPDFWQHIIALDAHVGFALPRAIGAGMDVRAVVCEGGYWDCGTPADYFECIREVTGEPIRS